MVLEAFVDPKSSMEVIGVAAIALGQIYVSTGNGEVTDAMITLLSEKSEKELATPHAKVIRTLSHIPTTTIRPRPHTHTH
jgi:hypothetical protein